ncbi:unnamed protein product, partial [Ixodes pacificus]
PVHRPLLKTTVLSDLHSLRRKACLGHTSKAPEKYKTPRERRRRSARPSSSETLPATVRGNPPGRRRAALIAGLRSQPEGCRSHSARSSCVVGGPICPCANRERKRTARASGIRRDYRKRSSFRPHSVGVECGRRFTNMRDKTQSH